MSHPPTGTVRLIHGDARRLPTLAGESVHLVVTSPPYPMIPQWDALFAALGARDYPAMLRVLEEAWEECHRVLVEGGLLAVVIGDALRSGDEGFRLWPNHAETLVSAARAGFRPLPYILWKKPTNKPNAFLGSGFLPPNAYVTLDCEFILLFRKGGLRRFPVHDPLRRSSRLSRPERDHWFSQVWDDVRGTPQRRTGGRTGAFPSEIPQRLVRMFSVLGDTVLDPFAGTGTAVWSAAELGRNAVGVEYDPTVYRSLVQEARRRQLGLRSADPITGPGS
ncbi:MAG: site-specific DNA-methyltransferase [Thermoplasmata archaeon]